MDYPVEWRYLAGYMEDGKHFHYVEFKKNDLYFRHWSVNGRFYEDTKQMSDTPLHVVTPQFTYVFKVASEPIWHKMSGKKYYSLPRVVDGKVEAWFDHERMKEVGPDWEWVGLNLNCGMAIMVYWKKEYQYCDVTFNSKTIEVKCILDGKHLSIPEMGMYLILDDSQLNPPTTRDIVYKPTYGRPYSEWSFDVISKGGVIGHGVREKTFKGV